MNKTHQSYDGEYTLRYIGVYSDGEAVIELQREGKPHAVFGAEVAAQLAVDILDKVNYIPTAIASIENIVSGRVAAVTRERREREDARKKAQRFSELKRETARKYFSEAFDFLEADKQQIVIDHANATMKREGLK